MKNLSAQKLIVDTFRKFASLTKIIWIIVYIYPKAMKTKKHIQNQKHTQKASRSITGESTCQVELVIWIFFPWGQNCLNITISLENLTYFLNKNIS